MNTLTSMSDFENLLQIPFEPKIVIYSLNSEFFRLGNSLCKSEKLQQKFAIDLDEEKESLNSLPEFPCGEKGCRATFTNIRDYDVHFRSVHSLVCSQCKRNFPTYNMLDIHIQEKHDSYHEAAKAKNLAKFYCLVDGCNHTYSSSEERDAHVLKDHNFPQNFKYQKLDRGDKNPEAMEISNEGGNVKSNLPTSSRRKPYVPSNICFGRGSSRTFSKNTSKKSNTDISMKELQDAL
ncbi:zinc finger protein 511-like [Argiope bruennichi]|uniref:Zinc finger protein 511 like protein n=1 Tax=Argiope bruennichi TaxID=94029 RepID=A0A8T0EW87_ARGBR|nr:zinc finger protein 511-like [Argiope bruennichi]KAF8782596.1 Zinc finger protein 511 like protein [Argiope bruennichi]